MKVRVSLAVGALAAVAGVGGMLAGFGPASSSTLAVTPASYPSCGAYWNRNQSVSKAMRRAHSCVVKAWRDGRRARLVAALTTIEGDPIVNYVFVRGRRDVLVVVDTTRDAFGARRWERFECTGLVVIGGRLGWTGCKSAGTGKPAWLRPFKLRD